MLRKHLGDELFFKSLNYYLTTNASKPVQTEQLRIAIEETTGQSMDWFFDQWLYKMGHPVFEVTQNYDDAVKKLTLNVKQTQKVDVTNQYPQVEFFQTFVDIEIDNKIERVWIEPKAENVFTFDVASKPKLVDFDNEGTLIKELKFNKSNDDLIYQFQNDKDVLGRLWAGYQLTGRRRAQGASDADKGKILAAISQTVTTDAFWPIRRDAILALAPQGNPVAQNVVPPIFDQATVNALMIAVKDKTPQVRAAAIDALSSLKDAKYADVFLAALNDQSYGVVDLAAGALGNTKDARAFDALSKLLETPSWKDRIRIAALSGLANLGDKRALEMGFKYTDKTYSLAVRLHALRLLAATGKGDERVYRLLMDNVKKALESNDTPSIVTGLRSLVRLPIRALRKPLTWLRKNSRARPIFSVSSGTSKANLRPRSESYPPYCLRAQ